MKKQMIGAMTVINTCADGTFQVVMTVYGLESEKQAQAAETYLHKLFCGEELTRQ